jgi:DNA mismatch repair protein MutL
MKVVHLLPPEISQKIAAGEVIERPVSVVKELVENSLDAGATEVKVELSDGGKELTRVADNGSGMSREDALLCFERHSTSKISSEEDLWNISTLGFRGEALASISTVSRLTLKTSDGDEGNGTLVEREGEKILRISDVAFPKGTSVEVRDLFFNLPVRRKFLRSDRAELGLIVRYLTFVALAYPEVRFYLSHGPREILNCPPVPGSKERIFQLYGKTVLDRVMECHYVEKDYDIQGYSSRPPGGRQDRSHQFIFVNRRPVKDRILQAALNQAYRGFLEKEHYPESFLFLTLPFSEVDVNVHPAKAEVRFKDAQLVFHLVLKSIERAMLKESRLKEIYPFRREESKAYKIKDSGPPHSFPDPREDKTGWQPLFPPETEEGKAFPQVLGQYLDTYIIASGEEGLLVVDQHNAHERILFDKYKDISAGREWPRKMLLVPVLFDLSPSEALNVENNQELLEQAGFRIEAMGGRSYALTEYPDIFRAGEAKDIFLAVLGEMEKEKAENREEKLLATLACKTAIKAGQPLSVEKMEYLIQELFKTSKPSLCPHGRPILVKIDRTEIEKGMRRGPN